MTRHPKNPDLPLYGVKNWVHGPIAPPSTARIAAELQSVALAIRLFGLSALPNVMKQEPAK